MSAEEFKPEPFPDMMTGRKSFEEVAEENGLDLEPIEEGFRYKILERGDEIGVLTCKGGTWRATCKNEELLPQVEAFGERIASERLHDFEIESEMEEDAA